MGFWFELGYNYSLVVYILMWAVFAIVACTMARQSEKRWRQLRDVWMLITVFGCIVFIRYIPTRYFQKTTSIHQLTSK
jgi:uncharacterized membrane protein